MPNPEHLEILKQGVDVWNKWREDNPGEIPGLSNANLSEVDLWEIDLRGAYLRGADFTGANLRRADLREANLAWTDFTLANLIWAKLNGSILDVANLTGTNLKEADLSGTFLGLAIFQRTKIDGAIFETALMQKTTLADTDMSLALGLETVIHKNPSTIGIDTLFASKGKIPEVFLRGAGVPESMINFARSLVEAEDPIQFYPCFISYSSKDSEFTEKLQDDLQNKGVRVWFASEDLKIGDKLFLTIDEAIRVRDKLMIVLSEHSIESSWVEREVETAEAEELEKGKTILFPIMIDDSVMETDKGWAKRIRQTRHIGDFTKWKDHDSYKKAFDRLLKDLREEN